MNNKLGLSDKDFDELVDRYYMRSNGRFNYTVKELCNIYNLDMNPCRLVKSLYKDSGKVCKDCNCTLYKHYESRSCYGKVAGRNEWEDIDGDSFCFSCYDKRLVRFKEYKQTLKELYIKNLESGSLSFYDLPLEKQAYVIKIYSIIGGSFTNSNLSMKCKQVIRKGLSERLIKLDKIYPEDKIIEEDDGVTYSYTDNSQLSFNFKETIDKSLVISWIKNNTEYYYNTMVVRSQSIVT